MSHLYGTSLSSEEQRLMERQTFLGEVHNGGKLRSQGVVIRQATEEKKQELQTMINEPRASRNRTPAQADAVRGTVHAYAVAVQGRIAEEGSQPLGAQGQAGRLYAEYHHCANGRTRSSGS